jgi:hypothetical protein
MQIRLKALCAQTQTNKNFESIASQCSQSFYCGSFDRELLWDEKGALYSPFLFFLLKFTDRCINT